MTILSALQKVFNRRWWWTTLLVIAGVAVLIRLGFWQLDRLDQRRAFNAYVAERWNEAPFDVNHHDIPADLHELEYRRVEVEGHWDYTNQIVLTNQTREDGAPGVTVVTPLVMDAPSGHPRAILVARGWVPINLAAPEHWAEYAEPEGAPVVGLIQESQKLPNGAVPTPPPAPQVEWYTLGIDAIQPQMPYPLLPVFILQLPEADRAYTALPYRTEPLALDEGSHFSYAIQWFMFAMILGVGYVFYIRYQELRDLRIAGTLGQSEQAEPEPTEPEPTGVSHLQGHA